ncbi:hypothetical protein BD311DRAFT_475224 [Dichomitus squalens]|uniref:Uncharacterized protein n=1 Tax=Dichomitus squalens TaxID=114155 RepID=A0A4Q9MYB5_9APHY|nr:hypothetical protein BD311DRAFT_475224 [Dichomitus squalens]
MQSCQTVSPPLSISLVAHSPTALCSPATWCIILTGGRIWKKKLCLRSFASAPRLLPCFAIFHLSMRRRCLLTWSHPVCSAVPLDKSHREEFRRPRDLSAPRMRSVSDDTGSALWRCADVTFSICAVHFGRGHPGNMYSANRRRRARIFGVADRVHIHLPLACRDKRGVRPGLCDRLRAPWRDWSVCFDTSLRSIDVLMEANVAIVRHDETHLVVLVTRSRMLFSARRSPPSR